MNEDEFRLLISDAMRERSLKKCLLILKKFRDARGEQQFAYDVVNDLKREDAIDQDLVSEVLDFIYGWCSVRNQIWDSRLKNEVLLYNVRGIEKRNRDIALLPGVPVTLLNRLPVIQLYRGTMIDLKPKIGKRMSLPVVDCFETKMNPRANQIDASPELMVICIASWPESFEISSGVDVFFRY